MQTTASPATPTMMHCEHSYFVGDAFEELRIDEPTTVEQHTVDVETTDSGTAETGISASLRTRRVLSVYIYLLEQLDREDALTRLYDEIYLEHTRFCKQYAQRLIDGGNQDRAIDVLEDGIHTFRSPSELRWLATDLGKGV